MTFRAHGPRVEASFKAPTFAASDGLSVGAAGHGEDLNGALFRPIRNRATGERDKAITPDGIYKLVRAYSAELGFQIGAHALRATTATNALDHQAGTRFLRTAGGPGVAFPPEIPDGPVRPRFPCSNLQPRVTATERRFRKPLPEPVNASPGCTGFSFPCASIYRKLR